MALERKTYTTEVNGSPLELEISNIAGQANAAVLGRWGETVVLATVVMGKNDVTGDFFPLTVDYEERFYAAGKIIGSRFVRRESRPSDEAILSARLIDRTIRPLFDGRMRREVQVVVTILAYDETHDPDLVSLIAVSTALGISDVPWNGPVGGVRFDVRDGERLRYQAFFAGTAERVNMIEFEGQEIEEKEAVGIFQEAEKEMKRLADFQKKIISSEGKKKVVVALSEPDSGVQAMVKKFLSDKLENALKHKSLGELKDEMFEYLKSLGESSDVMKAASYIYEKVIDEIVHENIIKKEKRPDGRKLDELRPLYGEVGIFKRTHGSGLFMRGNTHLLAVATLGSPAQEQLVETMEETGKKRFMLHYNFPGFSVGEISRPRGPGRREIGHGNLASKAVRNMIPLKDDFPYTIRIVAETLSSNGSSSMATVCATSLALMDAGVPIKKHVAGIAMGLMSDKDGNYKILTDIQGPEDHHGDMDFKVAGTRDGITAIQMDVKIDGITKEIFEKTLHQTRKARLEILDVLESVIREPREELSPYAPAIKILKIDPTRIGELIGPGGKTINGIIAAAGGSVAIDIDDDGTVFISSDKKEQLEKAVLLVSDIFKEYSIGEIVEGTVVKILEFGAIVDLGGKRDGMIHVSELKEDFVKKVEDVVRVGDRVRAKIVKLENGKMGLSLKGVAQS